MAPFDYDMVQILHKELIDNGVGLYLSSMLTAINGDSVELRRGEETLTLPAQAVVLAVGVAPETELASKAGLELGSRGIKVDHNYRTTDPDIYAVGDAVEYFDRMNRRSGALALAGPAQRQARAAAEPVTLEYTV